MSPRLARSAWTPWAGLFAGATGWFIHQQAGAGANYWDCRFGGPLWTLLLTLACAALVAIGGWVSWTSQRTAGEDTSATRRFSGLVGASTAAIFLMAIGFQTLASLIVPSCLR
ncbi:MAG: hypothetical protein JWO88_3977 [Frankiales bacterium]|nr:hypothetical protein [Frankiales bacterium]